MSAHIESSGQLYEICKVLTCLHRRNSSSEYTTRAHNYHTTVKGYLPKSLRPKINMARRERTPLQALFRTQPIAVLLLCLACCSHIVSSRPLREQLSQDEALAPKSTLLNNGAAETDNAPQPLTAAHQEARRLSNGANKNHRVLQPKRDVRNVGSSGVDNIPKYIRELYNNLTQRTATGILQQKTTRANTVRSLEAVVNNGESLSLFLCLCVCHLNLVFIVIIAAAMFDLNPTILDANCAKAHYINSSNIYSSLSHAWLQVPAS